MNEPVAWAYESKNVDGKAYISEVSLKPLFGLVTRYGQKEIPLYTHPVKQLSDEEIMKIHDSFGNGYISYLDFAKAIIKEIIE